MSGVLLEATGIHRSYRLPRTRLTAAPAVRHALRGVDLALGHGDSLGIVGGSGSGKSTLVRILLALDRPDAGNLALDGRPVSPGSPRSLRWFRRRAQVVLQDPNSSLDPRMTVADLVGEPLECLGVEPTAAGRRARVAEVLEQVGLDRAAMRRYPHEFSVAPRPAVLVGDEPVSALDVLVRGQVLDLLRRLALEYGLSLVLVSHDLGVVRHTCRSVLVLHEGAVVERGPTASVLARPEHPYTRRLLAAVPRLPEPADGGPGDPPHPRMPGAGSG